jgi:hypothetical protein
VEIVSASPHVREKTYTLYKESQIEMVPKCSSDLPTSRVITSIACCPRHQTLRAWHIRLKCPPLVNAEVGKQKAEANGRILYTQK